ncbi:hypothetical protein EKD04_008065 [Chloroflexales bacterium ZM16-3]|nr:hypothetical protein [Chloroflexales bacterium ZM16-3]
MHRERLRNLFSSYEPAIQSVIDQVLQLEQEYITMDRPRLKDQIDDIIEEVAKQELGITKKPHTSRA